MTYYYLDPEDMSLQTSVNPTFPEEMMLRMGWSLTKEDAKKESIPRQIKKINSLMCKLEKFTKYLERVRTVDVNTLREVKR